MKDILFKAKRIDNEEWVEGSYLYCKKATTVSFRNEHYILVFDGYGVAYHEIDKDTICQYTGLTDKNGNKIWENDIVNGIFNWYKGVYVIKWNDDEAGYSFPNIASINKDEYEVIGNIFDNPELIGE